MIVWSGRGYLIVLVLIVSLFGVHAIFPEEEANYAPIFAGLLSAIFSWFAGIAWNTKNERIVSDDKTGEKIILKGGNHTLFWIPMQYWGVILTVWSIIISFQKSIWLAIGISVIFCATIIVYVSKKHNVEKENKLVNPINTKIEEKTAKPEKTTLKPHVTDDHDKYMP